jgi:glyoxylase-like metal-dependent hydrolase (beta-lactamase superfamily II)
MSTRVLALACLVLCTTARAAAGEAPDYLTLIPGATPADRGPDGNTAVFEDTNGLIVFDTGRHPEHQAEILSLARQRGKPVTIIINSHWHLDHSGGNRVLRAAYPQAALYTSNAVRAALTGFLADSRKQNQALLADPKFPQDRRGDLQLDLAAIDDPRDLIPDHAVTGTTTLAFRGRTLQLHLAPYAATAGDTWLFDPQSRTLLAGDLVVLPVPFFDTACAEGWRRALQILAAQPFVRLYPGHGPVLSREEFNTYRHAFDQLVACSRSTAARDHCVDGWLSAAAPLLHGESDQQMARAYLAYYLDEVIRNVAKQQQLCNREVSSPAPDRKPNTSSRP